MDRDANNIFAWIRHIILNNRTGDNQPRVCASHAIQKKKGRNCGNSPYAEPKTISCKKMVVVERTNS
jgi:hypothetical protein